MSVVVGESGGGGRGDPLRGCHRKFLNEKLLTTQNVVYLKTAAGLEMRTGIRYTSITVILALAVLPVIRYQNGTVTAARREMYMTKCAAV
ncbi:hypothetical protein E2C01_014560 [Portunus trituberculatus]|uniref:Uncharacterized protein n=1 Tax=Portunus trituberculatus TaxID=210409 RepID=A0A5B7DJ67_PORTR|nr:hypothetical protein [Portunus trituberculatus]